MRPLRFRPSNAHRWLACPGSVWVSEAVPSESSEYAEEGTQAHAYLSALLNGTDATELGDSVSEGLPEETAQAVRDAAELVQDYASLDGYSVSSECFVAAKFGNDEVQGTADVILENDESIVVLDYKNGAGRKVTAEANPQLMLYGLGAWYTRIRARNKRLTLGILQPNGVGEGLDLWVPDDKFLAKFQESCEAAIKRAYQPPKPVFNRGPYCWGCVGRDQGVCPEVLLDAVMFTASCERLDDKEFLVLLGLDKITDLKERKKETAQCVKAHPGREMLIMSYVDAGCPPIKVTPPWWMLEHKDSALSIAKKIGDSAQAAIERGEAIKGWTTTWKSGRRCWLEPDEVPEILAKRTGKPVTTFRTEETKTKIIGITEAIKKCKGIDIVDLMKTPSKRVLVRAGEENCELDEEE